LWEVFKEHPEVLKYLIISIFVFLGFIFLVIAIKLKWITSFSIGKTGINAKSQEKQVEREFQSGNLNKLLDDQIHNLDHELQTFAISKANELRRSFTRRLITKIECNATRRAMVSVLRFPLYDNCRNNNFKTELKPENIKFYVGRIMKEVTAEYEDFAIEQDNSNCPVTHENCIRVPAFEEVRDEIEKQILNDWALPIRRKFVDICELKIKLYMRYIAAYREIGDQTRVKVSEHCIEKNRNYISALKENHE
jgi:hypothetical protein